MNDLELNFIQPLPVRDNTLIGLVELTEFACSIFYKDPLVGVNLFGFPTIGSSHF